MPGFALSKKALQVIRKNPEVEGLILFKHGIFTFGDTARSAYERMIRAVSQAERRLKKGASGSFVVGAAAPNKVASVADVAPILRGNARSAIKKTELDPMPRVIGVPGLGLFGLGNTSKAARIAADLAETNIAVISDAEAMERYRTIPERDVSP